MVVLKSGVSEADAAAVPGEAVARVRRHVGPVAAFRECEVVAALPKVHFSLFTPLKHSFDLSRVLWCLDRGVRRGGG